MLKNDKERWGLVAISFHWLMAALIIWMLCLGLYMDSLPLAPQKLKLIGWHKQTGALILGLALLRIVWRLVNLIPLLPSDMTRWQKAAADFSHYALYFFMFAMPLSGWLMSSAAGFPVSFFGLFTLPNLIAPDEAARKIFSVAHEWFAYALIAIVTMHSAAALAHHFVHKDNILRRMLPW